MTDANAAIGEWGLPGRLEIPTMPRGIVVFVHGSGSSRLSARNQFAAKFLGRQGFATLLFDLLTESEASDRRNVFDIALLAHRVSAAIDWVRGDDRTKSLPVGLFGASTGAAAAIVAAARRPEGVSAVVSRGGRPDLAGEALERVAAPVLLIVGGDDIEVLALNRRAARRLHCTNELVVIPHAGHLFEAPGTLDLALDAATRWFTSHVGADHHD